MYNYVGLFLTCLIISHLELLTVATQVEQKQWQEGGTFVATGAEEATGYHHAGADFGTGNDVGAFGDGYGYGDAGWDTGRPIKTVVKHVVKNIAVPHAVPAPVHVPVPKYVKYFKPFHIARPVAVPHVIPVVKHIQKPIPFFRAIPVQHTVPVPKFIGLPVQVRVPRPVFIHVPKIVPVAKKYPVPVTVNVPKPYIVPIFKTVPVPVPHKVPKIINIVKEVPHYVKKPVPIYIDSMHPTDYGGNSYSSSNYGNHYQNEYEGDDGGYESAEDELYGPYNNAGNYGKGNDYGGHVSGTQSYSNSQDDYEGPYFYGRQKLQQHFHQQQPHLRANRLPSKIELAGTPHSMNALRHNNGSNPGSGPGSSYELSLEVNPAGPTAGYGDVPANPPLAAENMASANNHMFYHKGNADNASMYNVYNSQFASNAAPTYSQPLYSPTAYAEYAMAQQNNKYPSFSHESNGTTSRYYTSTMTSQVASGDKGMTPQASHPMQYYSQSQNSVHSHPQQNEYSNQAQYSPYNSQLQHSAYNSQPQHSAYSNQLQYNAYNNQPQQNVYNNQMQQMSYGQSQDNAYNNPQENVYSPSTNSYSNLQHPQYSSSQSQSHSTSMSNYGHGNNAYGQPAKSENPYLSNQAMTQNWPNSNNNGYLQQQATQQNFNQQIPDYTASQTQQFENSEWLKSLLNGNSQLYNSDSQTGQSNSYINSNHGHNNVNSYLPSGSSYSSNGYSGNSYSQSPKSAYHDVNNNNAKIEDAFTPTGRQNAFSGSSNIASSNSYAPSGHSVSYSDSSYSNSNSNNYAASAPKQVISHTSDSNIGSSNQHTIINDSGQMGGYSDYANAGLGNGFGEPSTSYSVNSYSNSYSLTPESKSQSQSVSSGTALPNESQPEASYSTNIPQIAKPEGAIPVYSPESSEKTPTYSSVDPGVTYGQFQHFAYQQSDKYRSNFAEFVESQKSIQRENVQLSEASPAMPEAASLGDQTVGDSDQDAQQSASSIINVYTNSPFGMEGKNGHSYSFIDPSALESSHTTFYQPPGTDSKPKIEYSSEDLKIVEAPSYDSQNTGEPLQTSMDNYAPSPVYQPNGEQNAVYKEAVSEPEAVYKEAVTLNSESVVKTTR